MSVSQVFNQYQSKYSCKVQNVLLLWRFRTYKEIKKYRNDYTFSELYNNKLIYVNIN